MNNERLDSLFGEIRNEATETSVKEVGKWIAVSAASVGMFGLLSKFKLPFILTKKLIIMTSIIATIGVGATALFLSASPVNEKTIFPKQEVQMEATSGQILETLPNEISDVDPIPASPQPIEQIDRIDRIETLPMEEIENDNSLESISQLTPETKPNSVSKDEGVNIPVGYFNKLEIGGVFLVSLSQGESESVTLKNSELTVEDISAKVKNETLHISLKNGVRNRGQVYLNITMSDIKKISTSGASSISSTEILKAPNLEISAEGASHMALQIESENIKINTNGAAKMNLHGSAANVKIKADGASHIAAFQLNCTDIDIDANGAVSIQCKATGNLILNAEGASHISYDGNPSFVDAKTSVASSAEKRR